jgi:hypothetical protein
MARAGDCQQDGAGVERLAGDAARPHLRTNEVDPAADGNEAIV